MKKDKSIVEKGRLYRFKLGLIAALSFVLVSFEWADFHVSLKRHADIGATDSSVDIEDEILKVELLKTRPKAKKHKSATVIEIVKTLPVEPVKGEPELNPNIKSIGGGEEDCDDCDEFDEYLPITFSASLVEIAPYYLDCKNPLDKKQQGDCSFHKLKNFIQNNAYYPPMLVDAGVQGDVLVSFVVTETGEIMNAKVERTDNKRLGKEALKAVNKLPQMVPASQAGRNVSVIYHMPVSFRLD